MGEHPLQAWYRLARMHDASGLPALLADDAVFHSPVVHAPQRGRALVAGYLAAAFEVFGNPSFRYVREIVGEHEAALEFETLIDGLHVNGVDLVRWNTEGRIVDFKVMIRPLKAIELIHGRMAKWLADAASRGGTSLGDVDASNDRVPATPDGSRA